MALTVLSERTFALSWPDGTERTLRALSAREPAVRTAAVVALRHEDPIVAAPLAMNAMADADADVRLAAFETLAALRVPVPALHWNSWLSSPDPRFRLAALSLSSDRNDPALELSSIAAAIADKDERIRLAAVAAASRLQAQELFTPLLQAADDSNAQVRAAALAALPLFRDVRLLPALTAKASDSSSDVRLAVVLSLAHQTDSRATDTLRQVAERDPAVEPRALALAALGHRRDPLALPTLARAARDPSPAVREAATSALGELQTEAALAELVMLLGTDDDFFAGDEAGAVRRAVLFYGERAVAPLLVALESTHARKAASAAYCLGRIHAVAAAQPILAAARRGVVPASTALEAMGELGLESSVPYVLELLSNDDPKVRAAARASLGALLTKVSPYGIAVPQLAATLQTTERAAERLELVRLLGMTRAATASPFILDALNGPRTAVTPVAIAALARLPATPSATRRLLELIASQDHEVRDHAALALAASGGEEAVGPLLALVVADRGAVVDAALAALSGVLARVDDDRATLRLFAELPFRAGANRDALIEAVGRSRSATALPLLSTLGRQSDPADRAAALNALTARPKSAQTIALFVERLQDPSPRVRADALFALGGVGGDQELPYVVAAAASEDASIATNGLGAASRIAVRTHDVVLTPPLLCLHIDDPRPTVRRNALGGLALLHARCASGDAERASMLSDPSPEVRAGAASALRAKALAGDDVAHARMRGYESIPGVLRAADRLPSESDMVDLVTVYPTITWVGRPVPEGGYAIEFADGLVRVGVADRRGAVVVGSAPRGMIRMVRLPELR